jgi:hypothetical protein
MIETAKPDRLQDNIDSGYAEWVWWHTLRADPGRLCAILESANSKPKRLIANGRPGCPEMVEYLTRNAIRENAGPLTEQASIVRKAEARSPDGSSFLSHSTQESDLLPGVIAILERHGAVVYVDKKDETLPSTTNRETASILKNRIKQCRKFILLTTNPSGPTTR